ncbi:MAG: methyltransferase [Anaerolineae bacterium]|nr:methyltransferase [Anaerolineae bacterium]
MNSRERVQAALNHQEPDRVPIDFSGHRSSGIAAIAYAKLRQHLGLEPKPIRVYDLVQQLAIVDEDVLDRFHVDTIELGRGFALEDSAWADWVLPDGTPCQVPAWSVPERDDAQQRWIVRSKSGRILAEMPYGALYFTQTYFPLMDGPDDEAAIAAAFDESMWTAIASPPGPLGDRAFAEGARALRASTDRAILGLFGGNLLEVGQFFYRNDQFFIMMAAEPERTERFLDCITEIHLDKLERFLATVGDSIDIIMFGDDLGMQTGPQMSPAMYRRYFKPRHSRMWRRVKELKPHVKVMLHCCGSVRKLLPDLIDAGLDAMNPIQIRSVGMDAAGLKADFGQDITLWGGGCDTQVVLMEDNLEKIADHVREQVRILNPGGGFVFQQVHNILATVPPENVVAMFDAVHSGG